ncbi:hypothetical protein SPSIL_029940 [Sporomusa silvacetica DSM 10669]|uniref:Uncharacterized protein n=1 Tax=Sporomusa silvacetica DSM 10669 TaxID=1123289 RepID=A0ABZ3IMC2_9FIRM|nr:hypothetical protein [Sporomusa silvacetica]OZC14361.1 hypothetical protein SPSIL_48500 [Sporomusa silvacetica DSM 10669]
MKQYECKKVENCFSSANIYEYRLPIKAKEEFIECFAPLGVIKYHKNFPRPCFQASLTDGATIKGIIADSVIKVSFPDSNPQECKANFEIFLEDLLKKQTAGRER